MANEVSLVRLLNRGDKVAINNGRLTIQSHSGRPVPAEFMSEHSDRLIVEILALLNKTGYKYLRYSTGHYGNHKSGGVTLQFTDAVFGKSAYTCFNANLKRQRNTRQNHKGELLPKGEFSVGKGSQFYRFWLSTGLSLPERLSRFHKCMGKLTGFVFSGDLVSNEKINTQTLQPLNINYEFILSGYDDAGGKLPPKMVTPNIGGSCESMPQTGGHKQGTKKTQGGHKEDTRRGHKEMAESQYLRGVPGNQTTGAKNYGNKVIRKYGYEGNPIPLSIAVDGLEPLEPIFTNPPMPRMGGDGYYTVKDWEDWHKEYKWYKQNGGVD